MSFPPCFVIAESISRVINANFSLPRREMLKPVFPMPKAVKEVCNEGDGRTNAESRDTKFGTALADFF